MLKGATNEKRLETLMTVMCNAQSEMTWPCDTSPKSPGFFHAKRVLRAQTQTTLQSAQRLLQKAPDVPAGGLNRLAIATIAASLELCS